MAPVIEALECSVCLQHYNEEERCPLLLNCGHTFCGTCLLGMLKVDCIRCPQDRKDTAVMDGLKSLTKNYTLLDLLRSGFSGVMEEHVTYCDVCDDEQHVAQSYCVDCGQAMCEIVSKSHTKVRASKNHKILPVSHMQQDVSSSSLFCSTHDQAFRYFDVTCNLPICADCSVLNHASHKFQSLDEAAADFKKDLDAVRNRAHEVVAKSKNIEESLGDVLVHLEENYEKAKVSLDKEFGEVSNFPES